MAFGDRLKDLGDKIKDNPLTAAGTVLTVASGVPSPATFTAGAAGDYLLKGEDSLLGGAVKASEEDIADGPVTPEIPQGSTVPGTVNATGGQQGLIGGGVNIAGQGVDAAKANYVEGRNVQQAGQGIVEQGLANQGTAADLARQSAQRGIETAGTNTAGLALAQLQQGLDQANRRNLALAKSGGPAAGQAAMRQALAQNAQQQLDTNQQAAILRAQEENNRINRLTNAIASQTALEQNLGGQGLQSAGLGQGILGQGLSSQQAAAGLLGSVGTNLTGRGVQREQGFMNQEAGLRADQEKLLTAALDAISTENDRNSEGIGRLFEMIGMFSGGGGGF